MALNLPRLRRDTALLDSQGKPTMQLQIWWSEIVGAVEANEAAIAALDARITALEP